MILGGWLSVNVIFVRGKEWLPKIILKINFERGKCDNIFKKTLAVIFLWYGFTTQLEIW
jgi:hypothetical protein